MINYIPDTQRKIMYAIIGRIERKENKQNQSELSSLPLKEKQMVKLGGRLT